MTSSLFSSTVFWFTILSTFWIFFVYSQEQTCSSLSYSDCYLNPNCTTVNGSTCENSTYVGICVEKICINETVNPMCVIPSKHDNITEVVYVKFLSLLCPQDNWDEVSTELCYCPEPDREVSLFQRIVPIFVLVIIIIFLIRPVAVPMDWFVRYLQKLSIVSYPKDYDEIEKKGSRYSIMLDFATIPIFGVCVLLACGTLTPEQMLAGIVGDENIQPYAIIILFFSLAYVCISLDVTGVFDYISIKAIVATKGSGRGLFLAIFALSSTLTVFTSNDIVILTLTPIICGVAKFTSVDPTPLLFLQFFMANIWSIILFIGNPTNIIVATAYRLNFIEYSQWMALPAVAAGLTCLIVVWIKFRNDIPESVKIPKVEPSKCLKDRAGAAYGMLCLFTCLGLLLSSRWLPFPMWSITLGVAVLMLFKDFIKDIRSSNLYVRIVDEVESKTPNPSLLNERASLLNIKADDSMILEDELFAPAPGEDSAYQTIQVLKRLPWKIIFFVFGVFITVEALRVADWTSIMASAFTTIIGKEDNPVNIVISVFLLGILSVFACNILNNQPMTILFTAVLQEEAFSVAWRPERGAMYALIMGSNLGANFTLIGALAGIMWASILENRGIVISYLDFVKQGFIVMPIVLGVACAVLSAELCFF